MACNCKTEEEINQLYDSYSAKIHEKGNNFKDNIKRIFLYIVSILMWIIVFPLMLIYILFMLFWLDEKRINVQNINIMKWVKIFEDV